VDTVQPVTLPAGLQNLAVGFELNRSWAQCDFAIEPAVPQFRLRVQPVRATTCQLACIPHFWLRGQPEHGNMTLPAGRQSLTFDGKFNRSVNEWDLANCLASLLTTSSAKH
jgi:hypothetical protein